MPLERFELFRRSSFIQKNLEQSQNKKRKQCKKRNRKSN